MKELPGKRILIIVQNLPVPFDRRVWLEAKALTAAGCKVSVISPQGKDKHRSSYEIIEKISIYRYPPPLEARGTAGYIWEFFYCWVMTFYLSLKVLFREGFDAIHACNPPETFFLIGLFYKHLGKKYIFDHHDISPEMYLAKGNKKGFLYKLLLLLEKWTFKTANVVISTNESYKKIARQRGNVKEKDIFVVRSGPDFERLKIKRPEKELKENGKYLVCYLGEMCAQDGVDYLLRSIRYFIDTFHRKDTSFVLIGGGQEVPWLKELSNKLNLTQFVKFAGRVSDEDLCRYLSTADICVDPDPYSEWADESTMNKIMEYMTFAKSIIAFDLKENRYSAQGAALYARPNDIEEFARLINDLLNQPEKREKMGEYGRKRVLDKLSWEQSKPHLIEAYLHLFRKKENRKFENEEIYVSENKMNI